MTDIIPLVNGVPTTFPLAITYGKAQPSANWPGIYPGHTVKVVPLNSPMGAADGFFGINTSNGGFFTGGFVAWGSSFSTGLVISASQGGIYTFTVTAALVGAPTGSLYEGLVRLSVDQIPIDAADGSGNFTLKASTQASVDLVWKGALTPGQHLLMVWLYGVSSQVKVTNIKIEYVSALQPEPMGDRDGTKQSMSALHMINTAIGSGAIWSGLTDADTQALINGTYGVMNSAQYSSSVYTGQATDPVQAWHNIDTAFAPCADTSVRMPAGMVPGPPQFPAGGDSMMCLYDATQPRWMWSGFNNTVYQSPASVGVGAGRCQIADQYNGFNNAMGQGAANSPGIIRGWEVAAGAIKHMLLFAMPNQLVKAVPTPWTGLQWPAWEADYNGAFGQYTGAAFKYGSTIGIPSTVDITTLGLSAGGLILAKCLQDYGATQQITGGSPNPQVTLYHEVDTSLDAALFAQMQTDWNNKILPSCRIMRNQGPNSINGGGVRRQPTQPGIAF